MCFNFNVGHFYFFSNLILHGALHHLSIFGELGTHGIGGEHWSVEVGPTINPPTQQTMVSFVIVQIDFDHEGVQNGRWLADRPI